jgi:hypothetical protein
VSGIRLILARIHNQHLAILIAPEIVQIHQDAHHRVALTAADQILQRDPQRIRRFHHVEDLILHVLKHHRLLLVLPHLLLDGAKEVVEGEHRQMAFVLHVENSEEMLEGLGLLLVLHGQDKVQVGLVVHLALKGEALLKDPLDKYGCEGACTVSQQLPVLSGSRKKKNLLTAVQT